MNIIKKVAIEESLADYMQRVSYELAGYRNLIGALVTNTNPELRYTDDHYYRLMKSYQSLNAENMLIMNELKKAHLPDIDETKENPIYVSVNFDKCEAVFYYKEGSCCTNE